ncbi:MAG: ligase-associated DNA damage response DEXH box helicase [Saprospiraceae bacterium]|nr:ligase-associated DNA damage response DEXH box helicase [Saprospiraceae bacterium]
MENVNTQRVKNWFKSNHWEVYDFQMNTWQHCKEGYSGIVNAPTGSGKTYALLFGAFISYFNENDDLSPKGPIIIWVTPIRALAKEIKISSERALKGMGLDWKVGIRSGDTNTTERKKQIKNPPQIFITTPESIHVLLATKKYPSFFKGLHTLVFDEWHELMGSKRGVQCELAISRLKGLNPSLKIWGISATIGNIDEAGDVLLGNHNREKKVLIRANIKKQIDVIPIFPDVVEKYAWAGHLGLKLADKLIPIIQTGKTTLIFTNTRAQSEIWYQTLLDKLPDLAGSMAMHHGSISREIRDWVEDRLYEGELKVVVATSSLDLGVDFRPVETIVQIGSPKSVARFMQRAGRSGHEPGAVSKIYFLPTHSLELLEAAALRSAVEKVSVEERIPYIRSWDVLIQYLMTLAVSEGFTPDLIYKEVKNTHCFDSMQPEEWQRILNFLVQGSQSLKAYDEYQKVIVEEGVYKIIDRKIAQRHRLSIGTIMSDAMLSIKYLKGGRIGTVEEWFVSHLNVGDSFWFAGRALELVMIKDMNVLVRKSKKKTKRIPSYLGGRIPLSSEMSEVLREKLYEYESGNYQDEELNRLSPLFDLQNEKSSLPSKNEFLIEYFETKEGFHLLMYPFEGRYVHEGMGALIAQRLSRILPISFSFAMNDYGFELLSDKKIDVEKLIKKDLFSPNGLGTDIQSSINATELAKRRFREICRISGLIFQGFPGKVKKNRHLQASSSLLFGVFQDYEPENLLYLQTYEEVMTFQLEEARMKNALNRIQNQTFIVSYPQKPTPLAFPIIVDRMREKMSSEKLNDRIAKMTLQFLKEK